MIIDEREIAALRALPTFPFAQLLRPSLVSVKKCKLDFKNGQPISLSYPKAETWDSAAYEQALCELERLVETGTNSLVKELYRAMIVERRIKNELICAVAKRDDEQAAALGAKLYSPAAWKAQTARKILDDYLATRTSEKSVRHEKRVDAEKFSELVAELLAVYDPEKKMRVRLSPDERMRVTLSAKNGTGTIHVPKNLSISRARAQRLLAHEVEVHVLRFLNGLRSPLALLAHGTADVKRTEEGLALARQLRVRRDTALPPGFWDSYAAALLNESGVIGAHEELLRARKRLHPEATLGEHKKTIWSLILRNLHGINSPGRAGLLIARGDVYTQGLSLVESIDAETRHKLYAGRMSLEALSVITPHLTEGAFILPVKGLVREITERL